MQLVASETRISSAFQKINHVGGLDGRKNDKR